MGQGSDPADSQPMRVGGFWACVGDASRIAPRLSKSSRRPTIRCMGTSIGMAGGSLADAGSSQRLAGRRSGTGYSITARSAFTSQSHDVIKFGQVERFRNKREGTVGERLFLRVGERTS